MAKQSFDQALAFYEQLKYFYSTNRGKIRSRYNPLTKSFLDYNDKSVNPNAFLRVPQFEALELYVFIKEFLDNRQMLEIFTDWKDKKGDFADASYYSVDKHGAQDMFAEVSAKQTELLFKQMKQYLEDYPNYIFALTMGLGKTILMATCIFYEFLLANKYQKDPRYCHNALVFAPDKTVLQSLKEIQTFDKSNVVPPEYVRVLDSNLTFYFLDDTNTSLNALENSDFNIIISNTQKIIVKHKNKEDSAATKLFNQPSLLADLYDDDELKGSDENLILNQRFEKLCRLEQIGVYVDEAHHLFGKDLDKALHDKKETSLRTTINMLAEALKKKGSSVVACYNFTGTPYVNNQVLPEVVYACGLRESINRGYLKEANAKGFENVKNEEFLRAAITEFLDTHKNNRYEGLLPKMAIFAADIDEIKDVVKPTVEKILSEKGIPLSKILINVGDSSLTKDIDILDFNNLDKVGTEGAEKQFIILCEKGREGWNCRSLFSVALFRNSFSTVFVLQSTMRCLRQITDVQQTAQIFLSKDNLDILDSELQKNFNMSIKDLGNSNKKEKKLYQVRVLPPPRKIKVKQIHHEYSMTENKDVKALDFGLADYDYSKYQSTIYEKRGIANDTTVKQRNADEIREQTEYSKFTLVGELARYLNISCLKLESLLTSSKDGIELILEKANLYNDIIYDILVPKIFDALYNINVKVITEDKEMILLKEPKNAGYYEFNAEPALVVCDNNPAYAQVKGKSFHADTYCFDSKPEKECFNQYIYDKRVKEVYFTGMFTAKQGDLAIQYIDPESHRVRHYYPDFVAKMTDGSYQIIEVKGDNKIEDAVVKAKAAAAEELAVESSMEYKMYAGSEIMESYILDKKKDVEYKIDEEYGLLKVADSGRFEYGKK